jgi:hypothetical protein
MARGNQAISEVRHRPNRKLEQRRRKLTRLESEKQ